MKKITVHFLIQLMVVFSFCNAQSPKKEKIKMNKEVKALVKLGKDSISQLALSQIDKKASLENFTKTSVQTNGKEIYVVFLNPVIYLPMNTIFQNNAGINLMSTSKFSDTVANPVDFTTEESIPYYKQTAGIKKNIAFVVAAIPNLEASALSNFEGSLIIREQEDHYTVSVVSETQESWYKIKKDTGVMYDEGHAHLEPQPFAEEGPEAFREIKFDDQSNSNTF